MWTDALPHAPAARPRINPSDWVIHPLLFALYPILALFGWNAAEVPLAALFKLVALAAVCAAVVWFALRLVVKDLCKAGLITSAIVVLFFTFDRAVATAQNLINSLRWYWVRSEAPVSPLWVLLAEAIFLFLCAYGIVAKLKSARLPTAFLNVFSILLVVFPLAQVILVKAPALGHRARQAVPFPLPAQPKDRPRPDIYYIILDGYARPDVMKKLFEFDAEPFLHRLESKGFYLANRSTANYCQTPLCLSCSLNGVYLDELVRGLGNDQTELADLIGKNNVVETLKPLGYQFVTFATGFDPTEHPHADQYLSPHPFSTGFERLLIDQTPLRVIWPGHRGSTPSTLSRERIVYLLEHLPDVARDPQPTFTLAHLLCPHPPFIFGEHGEDVSQRFLRYDLQGGGRDGGRFRFPDEFRGAYRAQTAFVTREIEKTIDRILAASPEPPIIIVQSDHGSELYLDRENVDHTDLTERMTILNAYYFPGRRYDHLHQDISPVNSFRVVLNTFFGTSLDLLPDKSYFSTWPEPYNFVDVTAKVQATTMK
ncbi:MAG: hypothetical protein ACLQVF_32625 [Isosphaeraceae bacterium]